MDEERLIVVPLDGSALAERVIPYAAAFSRVLDASLLVLRVSEGIPPTVDAKLAEDLVQAEECEAKDYLTVVRERLSNNGVSAETQSLIGRPANEIVRVVEDRAPQLLVMSTHGRSGLSRWQYGSVATRVLREAPVSTMVIGPHVAKRDPKTIAIKRILVPLDGSDLAEAALEPAAQLAEKFRAKLTLARVIDWSALAAPTTAPIILNQALEDAAETYLNDVRRGIPAVDQVCVIHGMTADALIQLVAKERIDLVIMTSHTRTGIARAVLGSVADRMLQCVAPVLLVRPEGVPAARRLELMGRYCHSCGRASLYGQATPDDKCLRCHQHLRVCGNCVYHDGMVCLLQRPEAHDVPPGLSCPYFQFRESTARAAQSTRILSQSAAVLGGNQ